MFLSHDMVNELMWTVQVLDTLAGISARVAVVTSSVQELGLPLIIESTRAKYVVFASSPTIVPVVRAVPELIVVLTGNPTSEEICNV